MADYGGYEQWLGSLQRHPAFLNYYWCAMLANEMEDINPSDGFKIPYCIIEEELIKEDNNVNLTTEDAFISPILRHWLVHLLKAYDENVSILNLEDVLRSFIHNAMIRPTGLSLSPFPLSRSSLFHSLPSECKLWLIYVLRTYKNSTRTIRPVARDSLGNFYHIVSDCRLYVVSERAASASLPIDEARLKDQPWGALYRFVYSKSSTLLCENHEGWGAVWNAFQYYKLNELSYSIRLDMTVKLTEHHLNVVMREKQRKEFEEGMRKLPSIPKAEILENLSKNAMKKQKKKTDTPTSKMPVNTLETDIKAMKVTQPIPTPAHNIQAPQNKYSNEIMGKCWNFPQCPLKHKCKYVHPRNPCTKFPNCPRGWECLFLHDFCPNDSQCDEPNCPYEHIKSMTTYYRMPREADAAKPRPIASVAPLMREVPDQNGRKMNEENSKGFTAPAKQFPGTPPEDRMRCQYFPKCTKFHKDKFFHPTENCKNLTAGMSCTAGRRCFFLHGPCSKDGACEDWNCIYEHYKSPPVIERIMAAKKGTDQGTLFRAPSMSNISTCSGISRGRRKSVTFEDDSDAESVCSTRSKKSSTNKKPPGILRPSNVNTKRCPFGSRCTNQKCDNAHPDEKCKAFPKCPNGGICTFLHDICKNDGVCSKENCDFVHRLPHVIDNSWCKSGSRCRRIDCKFIHPQECIGRCPTPGECWMYHRQATATAPPRQAPPPPVPPRRSTSQQQSPPFAAPNNFGPGNGQGFGYPGHLGNGAVPPFGVPPGARYVPEFGYPPNPVFSGQGYMGPAPGLGHGGFGQHPGFAPGYGVGQGMGSGGYGLNPGYPHGNGYGHNPGMRGANMPGAGYGPQSPFDYGRNNGHNPTVPPRPTTPASSPPPPYPNRDLTPDEREFVERKDRIYDSTRL